MTVMEGRDGTRLWPRRISWQLNAAQTIEKVIMVNAKSIRPAVEMRDVTTGTRRELVSVKLPRSIIAIMSKKLIVECIIAVKSESELADMAL